MGDGAPKFAPWSRTSTPTVPGFGTVKKVDPAAPNPFAPPGEVRAGSGAGSVANPFAPHADTARSAKDSAPNPFAPPAGGVHTQAERGWLPKNAVAAQNSGGIAAAPTPAVQAERGWLPRDAVAVQNSRGGVTGEVPSFEFGTGMPAVFTFGQTADAAGKNAADAVFAAASALVD